jgi:diacylglycerol kinase (ATP)
MANNTKKNTGLRRLLKATGYSWQGFVAAWRSEAAFRQELLLTAVLIPLGIWLGRSGVERALLAGSCLVVLLSELLNSAIEAIVDRQGEEYHPLAGAAKDMGSSAVFVSLLLLALTWLLLLWDR